MSHRRASSVRIGLKIQVNSRIDWYCLFMLSLKSLPDLMDTQESIMSDAEIFLSKEDFQTQATTMAGSRDFGAQLFCALLRSVSIEARLVCSLQPLPFSGTVKDFNPSKEASLHSPSRSDDREASTDDQNKHSSMPSRTRRIGRPGFVERSHKPVARPGKCYELTTRMLSKLTVQEPRPKPRESSYPVFWVEAFNEAMQRWVVVDPVVTKTIGKPAKLEPPASDPYNNMSYVVAFEDDASARDVTRRYTKAFNAKTRKCRIESTKDGQKWWDNAMRPYEKPFVDDRDEAEVSELTSKSAQEPMPRNIQDFKDHPVYALERHVNRNQVIAPKRVIGHVGLSKTTAKSDNLEPVYRRSDVHIVRSADKWYRMGRDVKIGEQPLKQVTTKRPKSGFASEDDEADAETDLYAEYQTEIYRPPPVVNGRVPKNGYGNLDVYVPSMVPPGAVHIKQPEAARAARILGIDYADVVTGFNFRGRRGTAVFGGIAVATEYQEAVEEVLRGMADERQQALLEEKSAAAVQLWRLFLIKLRITERVNSYAVGGEEKEDSPASEMDVDQAEEAGGFLPEAGGGFFPEAGGGFFPEPGEPTHGLQAEIEEKGQALKAASEQAGTSQSVGVPDQDYESGGGFIPDETMDDSSAPVPTSVPTSVPTHAPTPAPAPEPTLASAPAVLNQQSQSSKAKKSRSSNAPRYELIVVPNKPHPTSQELPKTPERAPALEPEGSSEKAPIVVGSPSSKPASVELVSRPASPKMSPSSRLPQDSDSEISKGSRLSEDPEDEDAFPEWLL